jgi:hypothetical protein
MSPGSSKIKIREDGTIAGCYGTGKPIWPNRCEDCAVHSDCVCKDVTVKKDGKK